MSITKEEIDKAFELAQDAIRNNRSYNEEFFLKLIEEWQRAWMNVTGTDEDDRKNYLHRAMGVDANMRYGLARKLENNLPASLDFTLRLIQYVRELEEKDKNIDRAHIKKFSGGKE